MSSADTTKQVPGSTSDVIRDLQSLVNLTVGKDLEWYKRHLVLPMVAHKLAGTLIIALSVSLPLIASRDFARKNLVISIVAVLVALISGLNAFFRWGEAWKRHVQALMELKNQMSIWQLRMLEATHCDNVQKANEIAIEATKQLFDILQTVDSKNTEEFVHNLNFPEKRT